jgi:hypothetical protein
MAVSTTGWRFALPAAAASLLAVGLVFGPQRSEPQPPTVAAALPPPEAAPAATEAAAPSASTSPPPIPAAATTAAPAAVPQTKAASPQQVVTKPNASSRRTQSGSDGSFALTLPAGVYQVTAYPPLSPRGEHVGPIDARVTISDRYGAALRFTLSGRAARATQPAAPSPVTTTTPNQLTGVVTSVRGKPIAGVEIVVVPAR